MRNSQTKDEKFLKLVVTKNRRLLYWKLVFRVHSPRPLEKGWVDLAQKGINLVLIWRILVLHVLHVWAILRQNTDPSSPIIKSEKTLANLVRF
jgi:hypothetical protein